MATWDGKDSSIIANRFGNVYIKDYMDISGRLFVRRDASLNSRLFVMNDASFMGNLYVDGFLTENANFTVNGDITLNGRLMVAKDARFQSITQVPVSFTLATISPTILTLTSNSVARIGGNSGSRYVAYVNQQFSGNYFLTARLIYNAQNEKRIGFGTLTTSVIAYFGFRFGSLNNNSVEIYFNNAVQTYNTTYSANDIFSIEIRTDRVSYYINNNLLITYNNPNNVSLYPIFVLEKKALSTGDDMIDQISIGTMTISNSNVYVNDCVTANLNCRVFGDTSLNSNVIVGRDISCNGNISIGRNLIVGGNLAVKNYTTQNIINTTTTNYQLVIAEDLSLNGRLAVSSDTSLNGNLFVARDISCNGNLNVRTGIFLRDISVNGITIGRGAGGFTNTIFGNLALASNSAGINNTAVGYAALRLNTASDNTACGYNALASNTTGINNTAVGSGALSSNTTGSNNTAIGYNAGSANIDGSFNTYIGYNANADGGNYSYSTAVGANALITGSNQVVIGTSAETIVIPGKIRHANMPNKINYGVNNQSIPASSTATLLFPNSIYDSSYVNIGYNSANGTFTNNNPYTIGVTVSASVATAATTGMTGLMLSIVSSVYGVVGSSGICGTVSGQAATNCTATFPMGPTANNETFYVTVRNTKTSALLVQYGNISGTNIMIRVF
jgi:hypothetical protein